MNILENYLLNKQNKPQTYNPTPLQTPEQFAQNQQIEQQKQGLAEKLMQPTSLMNGVQNLLIHPKNALFGMQSNNQEVPISYNQQPIVGVDVTQQDYNNMQKQGLLPENNTMLGGIKENPRVGGLLQDFSSGFKENAQSRFNPSNLENNITDYGGKKGLAYRLGEGLGTAGKFMASPAGRGLMTMAGVGLTGGNPTQAMTYGLQAGLGNYNNVQQDKMNRNLLQQQGIDTSNIRGYLNNDMAKSYTDNYKSLNDTRYKFASLALRDKLGTMKDNTTKAKTIMDAFKSNMIDETQAVNLANMYGISVKDLNESNQTRNANVNEQVAPSRIYANYTAPQIAMGNYELNRLKADPTYQAELAWAEERAKKQASNYSEDVETYNTYKSKMPELRQQVANLNELAKTASYTKLGVAGDTLTRELGLPVSKGAVARTEYTAVINNQILPLLRETFGAQFTEREGESLRQSLGDVNKSPAEKQAVLNSFIRQKEMNIQSQARKINQYGGGNVPQSNNTTQRAVSKSGRPMIKVNGVWQYE